MQNFVHETPANRNGQQGNKTHYDASTDDSVGARQPVYGVMHRALRSGSAVQGRIAPP